MRPFFVRSIPALVAAGALAGLVPAAAAPPDSLAAIPRSEDYVLRVWDLNEGLPGNHVSGISQTVDGYLWLMTDNGLARFDGTKFTPEVTPDLPGDANRIFSTRDGALWVITKSGGLLRGNGRRFETIFPQGLAAMPMEIPTLSEDSEGGVWFRDQRGGTFCWKNGTLTQRSIGKPVEPGSPPLVAPGALGILNGDPPPIGEAMAPSRRNAMWVARGQKLRRVRSDGTVEMEADLSWLGGSVEISRMYESRDGDLWIGTRYEGLFRFRAGGFVRVATSHLAISAIQEDREGNLWVGMQDGGLNRLHARGFFLSERSHGLPESPIASLAADQSGRLWVLGRYKTPVRAVDSSNRSFVTYPGWPGGLAFAVVADPDGGMWFASARGLVRWKDGVFTEILHDTPSTAVLRDRRGDVWLATILGPLIRHRGGVSQPVPTTGGLVEPRALAEDLAGRIWVGTEGGLLFRREAEQFVPVPLPEAKAGESIRFIVADTDDTVWIGALKGGLYRWRAGKVARLRPDAGFPIDDLRSLVVGPDGDIWIGTQRGLFRVARPALEAAMNGDQAWLAPVYFGTNDGLPGMAFSYGFRNATERSRDGRLWFATARGVLEVDPRIFRPRPAPAILIEEFKVAGASAALAGGAPVVVPPRAGPIRIRYTLPDFREPERIRFRHRLTGVDGNKWYFAGEQREATFTNLPPGKYRFEVQASRGDGLWLPGEGSLEFIVRAAWWETMTFRIAAMVTVLLLLAGGVRMVVVRRLRARLRRLEQENALERERARIARDMHDDIGASLTHLAFLSDAAAGDQSLSPEATGQIRAIAGKARSVAGTLDRIVWTVNPKNDKLERLLGYVSGYAAEYLQKTGLRVRLSVPATIPEIVVSSNARHEILLACKEALNNIVKHARADHVTLAFSFADAALRIEIVDDGGGFDPATVPDSANGLANMRQRIATLGGSAEIRAHPSGGTAVTFTVPLAGNASKGSGLQGDAR